MTDPEHTQGRDGADDETLSPEVVARVKAAFLEVSALGLADREEYLDRHFGDDARARAMLNGLLGAVDRPLPYETLADDIVLAHHQNRAGATRAPAEQGEQGKRSKIGPYQLLEKLGEGGFGVVYLAEQRVPVKRRVAIKILKLGMDTKQIVARFEAERQALAMMEHPSIAKVFDAGSTQTGRPYFVMELVRGVPITEYCDSKRLGTRARLDLFVTVCHAIQHAHQKGIIHRDIKPSNVLIEVHNGSPLPKVIDFGIAKATGTDLTEHTIYTRHREAIGTPAYMSPEQAEMSSLGVDTRTDIYSLGVMLYELLTGTTPLDTQSLSSAGYAEMIRMIREDPQDKPSTRLRNLGDGATQAAARRGTDTRKLGELLRGDLDWIVMKCLEKDRSRRYETANGLAADLRRYLVHEPVSAGPPGAVYKLRKFAKRNRAQVLAGSLLAAVLVLGVVGTTLGMFRAIDQTHRAELELARTTEVKQILTDMLQSASPRVSNAADSKLLRQILFGLGARLENGEIQDELIAAELHHVIGGVYMVIQYLDEAELHCTRATELRTEMLGEEHPETLRSRETLAAVQILRGRFQLAEQERQRILEIRLRILGEDHPDTIGSMHSLGETLIATARYDEAESILTNALERSNAILGEDHRTTLGCMIELAIVTTRTGRTERGEQMFLETLARLQAAYGPEDPSAAFVLNNLGMLYRDAGRLEESEAMHRVALRAQRNTYGEESDATKWTMALLAGMCGRLGKLEEAEQLMRGSLAGLRENPGYRPEFYDERMRTLVDFCAMRQKDEEALRVFEELVRGLRSVQENSERWRVGVAMRDLAAFYDRLDRPEDADRVRTQRAEYIAAHGIENSD